MGAEKKQTSDASAENGGASGGRYHSRTVVQIKCALLSEHNFRNVCMILLKSKGKYHFLDFLVQSF